MKEKEGSYQIICYTVALVYFLYFITEICQVWVTGAKSLNSSSGSVGMILVEVVSEIYFFSWAIFFLRLPKFLPNANQKSERFFYETRNLKKLYNPLFIAFFADILFIVLELYGLKEPSHENPLSNNNLVIIVVHHVLKIIQDLLPRTVGLATLFIALLLRNVEGRTSSVEKD